MSETRSLSGVQFKLVSAKGTYLGTITVPHDVEKWLTDGEREVRLYAPPEMPKSWSSWRNDESIVVRSLIIQRSYAVPGAVEIYGMSIEEFERLDGLSFSPSMAYIKSICE